MSISERPAVNPDIRLSYAEYALFPQDGNRHEIIDGRHYMNPAPTFYHQTLIMRICFQLYSQIDEAGLGQVRTAPLDVQFTPHDVVQPDIVVVLDGNNIVTESRIVGVPDLLIEILSPSTRASDEQLKKRLYEQHGVPEYWIVDSANRSVHQFRMTNNGYSDADSNSQRVEFSGLDNVTVDLSRVW